MLDSLIAGAVPYLLSNILWFHRFGARPRLTLFLPFAIGLGAVYGMEQTLLLPHMPDYMANASFGLLALFGGGLKLGGSMRGLKKLLWLTNYTIGPRVVNPVLKVIEEWSKPLNYFMRYEDNQQLVKSGLNDYRLSWISKEIYTVTKERGRGEWNLSQIIILNPTSENFTSLLELEYHTDNNLLRQTTRQLMNQHETEIEIHQLCFV